MAGVARGLRLKGSAKVFTSNLKQARIAVVLYTVEKTCETPLLTYTENKRSHSIPSVTRNGSLQMHLFLLPVNQFLIHFLLL